MIRILQIISDTNIGGAGRALLNYLKYMETDTFESIVVLPSGSKLKEPVEALGVDTIEIDAMKDESFDGRAVKLIEEVIDKVKPKIVHTHGALSGRIAAKRRGVPVVVTRHSAFPFPDYVRKTPLKLIYRMLYDRFADRIIVISPAGADILTEIGVPRDKLDVLMNGVEPMNRASLETCATLRRRLGITPGDFVAGIVARIEDYKGHIYILDAVKKLRDNGRNIKLIIAGTGSFEDEVKKRTKQLELEDAVVFTGFLDDVAPVLSIMDVQINASYVSETSSLSILEGFSIGVPAIVTNLGGNPCLVEDGENGFLFEPKDSGRLAERLEQLMNDPALREKMAMKSIIAYERRFTGKVFAANVEKTYMRVFEETKKHGKGKR